MTQYLGYFKLLHNVGAPIVGCMFGNKAEYNSTFERGPSESQSHLPWEYSPMPHLRRENLAEWEDGTIEEVKGNHVAVIIDLDASINRGTGPTLEFMHLD